MALPWRCLAGRGSHGRRESALVADGLGRTGPGPGLVPGLLGEATQPSASESAPGLEPRAALERRPLPAARPRPAPPLAAPSGLGIRAGRPAGRA